MNPSSDVNLKTVLDMSVDDNDDCWADDEFIATIDLVIRKAEEASAAKHHRGEATPTVYLANPLQEDCGQILGPDGHSSHACTVGPAPKFPSFRPSDGWTAPPPRQRECDSGRESCQGKVAVMHQRGTDATGPPQATGKRLGSPLPSGFSVRSSLAGVDSGFECAPNTPGASHLGSATVPSKGGAAGVEDDCAQHVQLMAEKDRTISVLRCRFEEVQEHLDEILERGCAEDVLRSAFYQRQQLELERISAELLFKDHEIVEAQRARKERGEQLRLALAEASSLKEELEKSKTSRETGTKLERPRDKASVDALEKEAGDHGNATNLHCQGRRVTWAVPEAGEDTAGGLPSKDGNGNGDLPTCNEAPPIKESSKRRAGANGRLVGLAPGSAEEESPPTEQLESAWRKSEMYGSLRRLWGLKDDKDNDVSVITKLYATCGRDLYVLLSNRDEEVTTTGRDTDGAYDFMFESKTTSEKLHKALGKVLNGLARAPIIIAPLLEFCQHENVAIVGSALHTLRHVLQLDSACRSLLLQRASKGNRKGWRVERVPMGGGHSQGFGRVVFDSPRIVFHPAEADSASKPVHPTTGLPTIDAGRVGQEPPMAPAAPDRPHLAAREQAEAGFGRNYEQADDLDPLVKWMLQLALTSTDPIVKFEAAANIGVLVMDSEPVAERLKFGPLLCHGAMDVLMQEGLRADVRILAVRMVHLLLHCPAIMHRFCGEYKGPEFAKEGDPHPSPRSEKRTGNCPANSHTQGIPGGQTLEKTDGAGCWASGYPYYAAPSKAKLLEGLTECLRSTANGPRVYALRRGVIRLLTFMAACGDFGVGGLIQVGVSWERLEWAKKLKDDPTVKGALAGEGARAQNTVAHGAGLLPPKGQDLGKQGDRPIPQGLGDGFRVDCSDRAPNIPRRLLTLIDHELDIEEKEEWEESGIPEERHHLICEAVTLLCRFSSDTIHSLVVIGHLTCSRGWARRTLDVTNRLLSRNKYCKQPTSFRIADLAFELRERVLEYLGEALACPS